MVGKFEYLKWSQEDKMVALPISSCPFQRETLTHPSCPRWHWAPIPLESVWSELCFNGWLANPSDLSSHSPRECPTCLSSPLRPHTYVQFCVCGCKKYLSDLNSPLMGSKLTYLISGLIPWGLPSNLNSPSSQKHLFCQCCPSGYNTY